MPKPPIPGLTVQEFQDSDATAALELWLKDWHKAHPDQIHPLDKSVVDPAEWVDTAPAPLHREN